MQEVKKKMAKGAALTIAARLAIRVIGLVSTLILVRLLLPRDFGIVALGTAFVAAFELLRTFGFDMALIADQDAGRDKYDTAWTINLGVASAICVLLLILSFFIGDFYNEPELEIVVRFLALRTLIRGLENIGVVSFRKDLQFNKEFAYMFWPKLVGFCITVPLAFILRSYWAMVWGILGSAASGTLLSYWMSPYRPRICFKAIGELYHFSKWIFVNQMLLFIRHRAADFVIGKVISTRAVGLYSVSYEISHLVTMLLTAPVNRAVLPGYAKMTKEREMLCQAYLQVISLIALFSIPAALGIAATASLFVPIVLGENWLSAVPVIQILGLSGGIMALETNSGAAYVAIGKPKLNTITYSIYVPCFLLLLYFLVPEYGSVGAAWSSLLAGIATLPAHVSLLNRHLAVTPVQLLSALIRPAVSSVAMYFAVIWFVEANLFRTIIANDLLYLLACIAFGALVFLVIISVVWTLAGRPNGAEAIVIGRLIEWRTHQSAADETGRR